MLLSLPCFYSCTEKPPAKHKYHNGNYGFSMVFPKGWEIKEMNTGGPASVAAVALSPQENPYDGVRESVNIVVQDMKTPMGIEEYYAANLNYARSALEIFREYESGSLSINGLDARWLIYSARKGRVTGKLLVYNLVKGNRAYTITCMSEPDKFLRYRSVFEEAAKSFRVE